MIFNLFLLYKHMPEFFIISYGKNIYFDIIVIKTHGGKIISVDESTIDTNLLYATLNGNVITSLKFMERLEKVYTIGEI